jgi:ATP-dependent helicase/nuclease subunit B
MSPQRPNVWTTSAGLTAVLVEQVLQGFPLAGPERGQFDLSHWSILVPTRRAARLLEKRLFDAAGRSAMVLPRVRPIGDVEEDVIGAYVPDGSLPPAISTTAQLFLMLSLIDQWADEHPHVALAGDVRSSRGQALGLAESLCDLVNQLDTEEVTLAFADRFAPLELAEHREAILSLLQLVQEQVPARLARNVLMGPAQRRNRLIASEAQRIAEGRHHGPLIAAGSTGTNPATRKLLKAIALHPHGAVILPGLDLTLEDEAWDQVTENHPQYAMRLLLADLNVTRKDVGEFASPSPRAQLLREVMRPAATTHMWHGNAGLHALEIKTATAGLRLMEAPDRHLEARMIALLLRQVLDTPGARGALVTPDRDLGQQVTAELRRWNADIDDSAGEPLVRFGRAQLCALLIACLETEFSPASVVALLAHPDVSFAGVGTRHLAHVFEIACLRHDLPPRAPEDFAMAVFRARRKSEADPHAHPVIASLDETGWQALHAFAAQLAGAFSDLHQDAAAALDVHVDAVMHVLSALAPVPEIATDHDRAFEQVMQGLRDAAAFHPVATLGRTLFSISWALAQETVRLIPRDDVRLAIYGLAEARMIEADLLVLGGLNETLWPARVDPGPWFNRPMRKELGLALPERDIGITAHDFAQAAARENVVITWAKRRGTAPLTPSRFVLRLRALLQSLGQRPTQQLDQQYLQWAHALDAPTQPVTLAMPTPRPATALRPTRFSVTAIEKLIRDPYGIFARRILGLEPLQPLAGEMEPRLRGILFHAALSQWLVADDEKSLDGLLAAGQRVFADYMSHPQVRHFWWPRFVRMARAFVDEDAMLRADVVKSFAEARGRCDFAVSGVDHRLTAHADRVDLTRSGGLRFIDYKSGAVPSGPQVVSGLSPQLTLEAAILVSGEYENDLRGDIDDLLYIQIGGGRPPVSVSHPVAKAGQDVAGLARLHLARLKALLAQYQSPDQPYVPRAVIFKERDISDYDHLSRFAEWSRGGA